ncbi:WYL domain-containing protein [Sanguibacter sp. Z1732]|uniref:WYL domain-containing protein n=1 Tax=Sanguibacter sp. Z1732 TaxID=3435412 RepID=UPI003D9CA994
MAVLPERAAALRVRATAPAQPDPEGSREVLEVEAADPELIAEELAGYGEAVVVLDPPQVREAVLRRLRAIAHVHPGQDGGPRAG